ncbi:MAG TPA: flagellin, partial [Acidobacteriaceae bacterium]|nr:flagellin [Acidobacteriaceae bacterium]
MSLSILNNIAALYAENDINSTQSKLQTTLQQLSSGSRINSGADDPAGLAVADGLGANAAALTQSAANATDGIGALQTADGALSQVTSLLDRAVTLATESANGTLTAGQVSSANQEYQNILTQIGNIGSTTNFNSTTVFSSTATDVVVTDGTSSGLNTYADVVGALTTSSVGTSTAAPVTSAATAPVTSAPIAAVSKTAGVYTLTPAVSSDVLSGQLSFTVGSSGTTQNLTVAPGTTLTALAAQLTANNSFTAAGLTAG